MSLINAVKPLLNSKTATVTLDISANPKAEGELVVVAKPVVGPIPNNAPEELKALCGALSTYLKAIGTPETIEAELYAVVNEQVGHRSDWASRAAALEANIAAGAKKDKGSKGKGGKTTTTKADKSASAPAKDDESDLPPIGGESKDNPGEDDSTPTLAL
ncbi:MAG: hypothetical protein AWU57_376 [Marinobacter sp. T13-3]|nr:MAG: hypothetical protein AWU57_376 [Marinobacter sp. T13-3]